VPERLQLRQAASQQAHTVVLVAPAGKSGHLELGWSIGQGKKGYVLFDQEPERWDAMLAFTDGVFTSVEALLDRLQLDEVKRQEWLNQPKDQNVKYDYRDNKELVVDPGYFKRQAVVDETAPWDVEAVADAIRRANARF
jgi:hypothetical protein